MVTVIIIITTLLLLGYFVRKNKNGSFFEERKIKKILIYVGLGIAALIVSFVIENVMGNILLSIFSNSYSMDTGKIVWNNKLIRMLYNFLFLIIVIATTEELTKILPAFFIKKNERKMERTKFDYIIPFLIVGITFSILEDIKYIIEDSDTGIWRLATVFIGHPFWAILIGNGYYNYKVREKSNYICCKIREESPSLATKWLSLDDVKYFIKICIMVIAIHGIYDYSLITFPILGIIILILSFVMFVIYMIKLKNTDIKEDCIKEMRKIFKDLSDEDIKQIVEEKW